MFVFKTEETQEATLNRFFPLTQFCLIRYWELTQFWRNSLVLAVNYVDFFKIAKTEDFLYMDDCVVNFWNFELISPPQGQYFKCDTVVSLCFRLVVCLNQKHFFKPSLFEHRLRELCKCILIKLFAGIWVCMFLAEDLIVTLKLCVYHVVWQGCLLWFSKMYILCLGKH